MFGLRTSPLPHVGRVAIVMILLSVKRGKVCAPKKPKKKRDTGEKFTEMKLSQMELWGGEGPDPTANGCSSFTS